MWLTLLLLVACEKPAPDVTPEPDPSGPEHLAALTSDLNRAHRAWSEGRRDESAILARAAYVAHFEPLEPALRSVDPAETLQLEYGFGVLAQQLKMRGDSVKLIDRIRDLTGRTEALLSAAPPPE